MVVELKNGETVIVPDDTDTESELAYIIKEYLGDDARLLFDIVVANYSDQIKELVGNYDSYAAEYRKEFQDLRDILDILCKGKATKIQIIKYLKKIVKEIDEKIEAELKALENTEGDEED